MDFWVFYEHFELFWISFFNCVLFAFDFLLFFFSFEIINFVLIVLDFLGTSFGFVRILFKVTMVTTQSFQGYY